MARALRNIGGFPTPDGVSHLSPTPSDRIVWQDVEGELVLFDLRDEKYHGLNPVASEIWRSIARGDSVGAIIDTLAARHAAPRATVADDVNAFVAQALAGGLLEPDDTPA
ncbi:MAG: PqqD family protein [Pseudomonadota bacterium]|uniref:PqqD family protein n=1 Tax=Sphingomonas sp. ERG5 TaxID=1381597 RepID=UPI00054B44E2|nr:PqqD family protein [Sphingomonas sp. ERG5]